MDQDFLLNKSKTFCLRPWVHLYINTEGNIFPCCISHEKIGNIKTHTIDYLWNNPEMKSFRLKILSGKKIKTCADCYTRESSGLKSLRQFTNEVFQDKFKWVESTAIDGFTAESKPVFWDIRFSNICNFRCRTCSHHNSSKWFEDAQITGEAVGNTAIIRAGDSNSILSQLEKYIDEVEEIYFAGGEPLVMEENFSILKLLISKNKSDVRLWYNTNFSNLRYNNCDILNLWSNFNNVTVSASLDDSYKRAEYIRKDHKWQTIIENRKQLAQYASHVQFKIQSTISVFNCYHFTDFHKEWIEKNYVSPQNIEINILHHPEYYNIQLLPLEAKNKVQKKINDHIEYIKDLEKSSGKDLRFLISSYEGINNYLFFSGKEMYQLKFREKVKQFDSLRNESFQQVFPEYQEIFHWGN